MSPAASATASERVTGHSVHGQRIDTPSLPGKARLIGIVVPMPDPGNGLTSRTAPALGHNSYSMPEDALPTFHLAGGPAAADAELFVFPFFEGPGSSGAVSDVTGAIGDAFTRAAAAREMTGVPFEQWWSPVADGSGATRVLGLGAGPRERWSSDVARRAGVGRRAGGAPAADHGFRDPRAAVRERRPDPCRAGRDRRRRPGATRHRASQEHTGRSPACPAREPDCAGDRRGATQGARASGSPGTSAGRVHEPGACAG